jgi:uncharacterized protein (DUF2062 family)
LPNTVKNQPKRPKKIRLKAFLRLARRTLFNHNETPKARAYSVAVATFIAFVPLYGLQTILGIAVAFWLRLNKVLIIVLINIITPYPLVPLIMYFSFKVGGWFMANPAQIGKNENFSWQLLKNNLFQYLAGGLLVACFMAVVLGGLSYPLFTFLKNRRLKKSNVV